MTINFTLSILLVLLLAVTLVSAFQPISSSVKTPSPSPLTSTALFAKKKKAAASAGSATKVQVRLKHGIAGTGQAGDIIMVTPAFFNNKLRPQGLAERISDSEKEAIEEAQQQERAETVAAAEHLQETLGHDKSDFVLKFTDNKTGPDGKKLFGGINAKKLMDALQKEVKDDFLKTHKQVKIVEVVEEESGKKVKSSDIKQTGEYLMKLQLTRELFVRIKIVVENDAGDPVPSIILSHARRPLLQRRSSVCLHSSSTDEVEINNMEESPSISTPSQRLPQQRRQTTVPKKPRGYWKNPRNVERELRSQWVIALGDDDASNHLPKDKPPPIPNFTLLYHWGRNDLVWVLRNVGSLELAYELGGATVIPGKWKEAVKLPLIQRVVELDGDLSLDRPPPSPQQKKDRLRAKGESTSKTKKRKRNGYWTKKTVILELYTFLMQRKKLDIFPSVWMPRGSDISRYDNSLTEAIKRTFGSLDNLCKTAGLIEYHEWRYLERQHDLMICLRDYLDENYNGDYTTFPKYSQLIEENEVHLYRLIQDFGGHSFVASRLGMQFEMKRDPQMSWGPFDLEYGIALMNFVRNDQMEKNPPLKQPSIFMPTSSQFLEIGSHGKYLHEKTMEYGGYEAVARRLGLEWNGDRTGSRR